MVYFSEIFGIEESVLEECGALNISLLNDLPLFVDPFCFMPVRSRNIEICTMGLSNISHSFAKNVGWSYF